MERLRAFCGVAMNSQDWIDVEPFFTALATQAEAVEVLVELVAADAWLNDATLLDQEARDNACTRWEAAWERATALAGKGE